MFEKEIHHHENSNYEWSTEQHCKRTLDVKNSEHGLLQTVQRQADRIVSLVYVQ